MVTRSAAKLKKANLKEFVEKTAVLITRLTQLQLEMNRACETATVHINGLVFELEKLQDSLQDDLRLD